ncbi:MAG: hemerythrin domain-containing protein [Methylovulum sp.]|nr:hemerythrin domain-containing protein [Methylovulum sp.]
MKFEWKDEYSLGNATMDSEHRRLFELANVIIESETNDELIKHIMQLYKHVREHFHNEEEILKEQAYPDYKRHCEEHNEMLDSLVAKSDAIREGDWGKTQAIGFMTLWVNHITTSDRQVRDYLASR